LIDCYQCFAGTHCLHIEARRVSQAHISVLSSIHEALRKRPFKGPNILYPVLLVIGFLEAKVLVIHLPASVPLFSTLSLLFYSEDGGRRLLRNMQSTKLHGVTSQKIAIFILHVFTQNIA
jgi:hypothetical protein